MSILSKRSLEREGILAACAHAGSRIKAEGHWNDGGEEYDRDIGMMGSMTEGEDNVELDGNCGLCCATTSDIVPLINWHAYTIPGLFLVTHGHSDFGSLYNNSSSHSISNRAILGDLS